MKNLILLSLLLSYFFAGAQTAASIRAQIDTDITNKVGAASITKTAVGTNMKSIVDFTVQEIATVNLSKEATVNKSTNLNTDGASNIKYPSVNAVKTYVDNLTAESYTNKSTNVTTDGTSNSKYPTVKAVKDYVDSKNNIYKKYVALITQTGTGAPIVNLLENEFTGTITWTRTGAGRYTGTITGNQFTNLKTFFTISQIAGDLIYGVFSFSENTISIDTWSPSSSTFLDGQLSATPLEIRVYN